MAAGMDFSPPFTVVEGGYSKDNNVSSMENQNPEILDNLKQPANGKPPRHLSVMRHSMSSIRMLAAADLTMDVGIVVSKSPSDEKSNFLPVFRSGSCAEGGPKQYMEDEHVCIDNLIEHLGATANFPPPGAFYGAK